MSDIYKSDIHRILHAVFGYHEFRDQQEAIINDVLSGHDVRVIMPTGGGKSICYQVPALVKEGLTIVISPLIALMEDQVIALKQLGVPAAAIHSGVDINTKKTITEDLSNGRLKMLYMAPESFLSERFMEFVSGLNIQLVAIDEAHCISVWGNDFRPEYTRLSFIKERFPQVPMIALTATADDATRKDISIKLGLQNAKEYISSFERKNITITAKSGIDRIGQIKRIVQKYKGESGIIYCLSRKSTEDIADKLKSSGFNSAYYHAGMDSLSRSLVQKRFQNDEIDIICATIAFGMGIDKSNVRYIVHYNLPKNIESFYQEIGRSGRDGLPSESLLFYSWADHIQLRSFIDDGNGEEIFKEVQRAKLDRVWEFANASTCRTNMILSYFGEYRSDTCGHCDNCLYPPSMIEGTLNSQMALSAIARTQEAGTLSHIVDILKGVPKTDIVAMGWDKLKTFGVGRAMPFNHWKSYITQMINQGLITIDYTDQNKLKLTPLSQAVLSGESKVEFVEYQLPSKQSPKRVSKTELVQDELFEELRKWRKDKAIEMNVPAYLIFSDATLKNISSERPIISQDLLMIDGIGDIKQERYGEEIITVIQSYLKGQGHLKKVKGSTHLETLELFKAGLSIDTIAMQRKLNALTIYSHLAALYERGEAVDLTMFCSPEELNKVGTKWKELNEPTELKPIFEALGGQLDYYKIRLGIAYQKKQDKT
jgi:ATP-dependent DNA helicase RecQ